MVYFIIRMLSGIVSVYMVLICIRILLTWFGGIDFGRPFYFLCGICDPYLNWFRRFRFTRIGAIDFSPILALAVLSLVQQILGAWSLAGRISLGYILALIVSALWSVFSWILGFLIIILILRLIAFIFNFNIYSIFWRFVDYIAEPVMYRISRILFPSRIINYLTRIILCIIILGAIFFGLRIAVAVGTLALMALPI